VFPFLSILEATGFRHSGLEWSGSLPGTFESLGQKGARQRSARYELFDLKPPLVLRLLYCKKLFASTPFFLHWPFVVPGTFSCDVHAGFPRGSSGADFTSASGSYVHLDKWSSLHGNAIEITRLQVSLHPVIGLIDEVSNAKNLTGKKSDRAYQGSISRSRSLQSSPSNPSIIQRFLVLRNAGYMMLFPSGDKLSRTPGLKKRPGAKSGPTRPHGLRDRRIHRPSWGPRGHAAACVVAKHCRRRFAACFRVTFLLSPHGRVGDFNYTRD
jgi:hypothetical protein